MNSVPGDQVAAFSHARNKNPAPPLTIDVENGEIVAITISNAGAFSCYSGKEISALFEAAGLGKANLFIPVPEKYSHTRNLLYRLKPGRYDVLHVRDQVALPESAFEYA